MLNKIKRLCRLPVFGKKTVLLSFEFGLVLSETAKDKNIEITPHISAMAEKIFLSELKENGFRKTALNFTPLILACLEK